MLTKTRIRMTDLGRHRPFETELGDGLGEPLTPEHTVEQAVDHYLTSMDIPHHGLRWTAFSRGVRLDMKQTLHDLPEQDAQWTVIPEVSAGGAGNRRRTRGRS